MTAEERDQRFHDLAVKEALGTISPEELRKLDRLQKLRRPDRIGAEIRALARNEFNTRTLLKTLGHFVQQAKRRTTT